MAQALKDPTSTAAPGSGTAITKDYLAWLEQQIALLRAGRVDAIDAKNIAEELSDMGKTERRQLESALQVLLMHMLKWDQQPERRSRSWAFSIAEQRRRIGKILKESPSLRPRLPDIIAELFPSSRGWAAIETHLNDSDFPKTCPYAWADIMDRPFAADEQV